MGRFRHPNEEWGSYVDVKTNAAELLRQELTKLLKGKKKKDIGTIFLSSVTDPYQGLEAKYKLTRRCLKVLADFRYGGSVGILTKSHLVLRDVDLFKKIKNILVGLTVTSTSDPVSKYLETYTSPHENRIRTLKKLHQEDIKTYAFVGPLLPHFAFLEKEMTKLLKAIKESGVSFIYLEHINLSDYIRDRLFAYLQKDYPGQLEKFKRAQTPEYRQKLNEVLARLTKKFDLVVAHQKPIYHKNKNSWQKIKK